MIDKNKDCWIIHPLMAGSFGPVPDVYVHRNGIPGQSISVPSLIYLLIKREEIVVIDTSFRDPDQASDELNIQCERKIEIPDLLAEHEIETDRVDWVIFTHLHWDHAGCGHLFPNAKFICQVQEIRWLNSPPEWEIGYEQWSVANVRQIGDRLQTVRGDKKLTPGIALRHVGGHTNGSQAVEVDTDAGKVLITGDTIMLYDNVEKQIPVGLFHELRPCVDLMAELHRKNTCFIPSHDWKVLERYGV